MTTAAFNGYCTLGATVSSTSGLKSSNFLQGVIPQCKVTVYLTGTLTPATIYSNAGSGSLTNPFTANVNGSWLFFAAEGQGYDVVMSGGFQPNAYPYPVTLTDLMVGGGSGGGVTVCAPSNAIQIANTGATNLTCDSEITENTATHSIYVGGPVTGNSVSIGALNPMPSSWNLDTTTPLTAINSMTGAGSPSQVWTWNGTTGNWSPSGGGAYPGVTSDSNNGLTVVGNLASSSANQRSVGPVTSTTPYSGGAVPETVVQQVTSGGTDSTLNESRQISINNTQTTNTLGTAWAMNTTQHCYSPNDCIPFLSGTDSIGVTAVQNEGMNVHISLAEQGAVSGGTLGSPACTTTCVVSIAQTYGSTNAWGSGTEIIDLTHAYSTGAVTNISSPQVTGTGTNWDAAFGLTNAVAVTTAAINNPGSVNSFPRSNVTIPIGPVTGGGFTTGKACAFDNIDTSWQCFNVTAVGSGTITADVMGWPLTSGSVVAQGGLTGYGLSIDIDTVSPGNLKGYGNVTDQAVTGTIRQVRPIVSNQSGNIITVYVNSTGEAQFNTRAGSGVIISGAGLYHILPQVRVLDAKSTTSGLVDGTSMTTTPFVGTFNVGDTVEEAHYFAAKVTGINLLINNWQSMPGWGKGFSVTMSGTSATGGLAGLINNVNDPTIYSGLPSSLSMVTTPGYGNLQTPLGILISGPFASGLWKNYPSFGQYYRDGLIHQDCATWCPINQNIEIGSWQNNVSTFAEDALLYNPDTYATTLTAGSTSPAGGTPACQFNFKVTGFSQQGTCSGGLPLIGTLNLTTATSDSATIAGVTSSSHCVFSPTNSTAAASTVAGYVSAVGTNSVTIAHVATSASGGTMNILCSVN